MAEHTPGPWSTHYATYRSMPSVVAVDEHGYKQGYIAEKVHGDENARLIAAAPDLLAALQDLYDDWPGPETETLAAARVALAKALGPSS